MKKNRKQWMKYASVILSFVIMAGFFLPGNKAEVNATEGVVPEVVEGAEAVPEVMEAVEETEVMPEVVEAVEETEVIPEVMKAVEEVTVPEEIKNVENDVIEDEDTILLAAWTVDVMCDFAGGTFNGNLGDEYVVTDIGLSWSVDTDSGEVDLFISSDLKLTRDNDTFLGWLCSADNKIYQSGASVNVSSSIGKVTFTAQWQEAVTDMTRVSVSFDFGEGTYPDIDVPEGFILNEERTQMTGTIVQENDSEEYFYIIPPYDLDVPDEMYLAGWRCDGSCEEGPTEDGSYKFKWENFSDGGEVYFSALFEQAETDVVTVTIEYDFKGGTLENLPEGYTRTESGATTTITQVSGETIFKIIVLDEAIRTNYTFDECWDMNNTGYYPKQEYQFNWADYAGKTIRFEAEWSENTNVILTFMDGSEMIKQDKLHWKGTEDDEGFTVEFPEITSESGEGFNFIGWLCSKDNKTYTEATLAPMFKWTELGAHSSEIIFTTQWEWIGGTLEANKEYYLKPGFAYTISEGTWKVNSDGYSYNIGKNFYVSTAGNYTFTK